MAIKTVQAPIPGTFYRAANPGDPPFKADDDPVQAGDAVGLIEVMKTFNQVVAEEAGRLVRFLIENEGPVMAGQPLGTLFVANRGEIAARILRAARELGIATVQAVSEADRDSLPARMAYMERAETACGVRVAGHIVLLCTGFHARTYPTDDAVWTNPLLTVEATRWLHDRGSRMHGVEGPSTDKPTDNIFGNHRLCRELGISHWEWLVNLEQLVGRGEFQFYGVPLKVKGGSGSPVRAFAIMQTAQGDG